MQLDADDELHRRERGNFLDEAPRGGLDQGLRVPAHQILCRCSSFLPITMRWISEVPSPISSSGASR